MDCYGQIKKSSSCKRCCVQDAFFYIAKNFGKVGEVDSKVVKRYSLP